MKNNRYEEKAAKARKSWQRLKEEQQMFEKEEKNVKKMSERQNKKQLH